MNGARPGGRALGIYPADFAVCNEKEARLQSHRLKLATAWMDRLKRPTPFTMIRKAWSAGRQGFCLGDAHQTPWFRLIWTSL